MPPGFRLLWRHDGSPVHDHLGPGYPLLRLGGTTADTTKLEQAIRDRGAPITVHQLNESVLRTVYGADLLLLRPDLHVAWRGDTPPANPTEVADRVTGWC